MKKLVYTKAFGRNIKAGDTVRLHDKVLTTSGDLAEILSWVPPVQTNELGNVCVMVNGGRTYVSPQAIDCEWREENKIKTLLVYAPFTLIDDTAAGEQIVGELLHKRQQLPFKDDAALLAAIADYSQRGFYCQVI